jgi:ADP-ribose pyrophosphatase
MNIIRKDKPVKIPKGAKLVFKGMLYNTYHWRQKMFDGSYETYELLERPDGVQVLPILSNNKIMIAILRQPHRQGFYYTLPGGRMDKGETPKQAAQRELREETGHRAAKFKLWQAVVHTPRIKSMSYTFVGQGCRQVGDLQLENGERIKLKTFSFDQFLKLAVDKNFRNKDLIPAIRLALYNKVFKKKLHNFIFN